MATWMTLTDRAVDGWALAVALLVIGLSARTLAQRIWQSPEGAAGARLRADVFAGGVVAAIFMAMVVTAADLVPLLHPELSVLGLALVPLMTVAAVMAALWLLAPARAHALGAAAWLLLGLLAASVASAFLLLLRAAA